MKWEAVPPEATGAVMVMSESPPPSPGDHTDIFPYQVDSPVPTLEKLELIVSSVKCFFIIIIIIIVSFLKLVPLDGV